MQNRGITLVELLVVISVIGILLVSLGISFDDWVKRYEAEKITRELYQDLMHARIMAMERDIPYLAVLDAHQYSLAEDRNENGEIDDGEMLPAFPKTVKYELRWNATGAKVICDARGLVAGDRSIWVISGADADYDCMKISRARIITGKYDRDKEKCIGR